MHNYTCWSNLNLWKLAVDEFDKTTITESQERYTAVLLHSKLIAMLEASKVLGALTLMALLCKRGEI